MHATISHPTKLRRPSRRAAGATLLGLALTLVLIAALLTLLVLIHRAQRVEYAREHTIEILQTLSLAMHQYTQAHGPIETHDTHAALRYLLEHDPSADLLHRLELEHDAPDAPLVRDGFAHPIRYVPADGSMPAEFVSPGPSGEWGHPDAEHPDARRAAADNIHSSDLEMPR